MSFFLPLLYFHRRVRWKSLVVWPAFLSVKLRGTGTYAAGSLLMVIVAQALVQPAGKVLVREELHP